MFRLFLRGLAIISFFIVFQTLFARSVHADWYNANWQVRKSITIDHTQVAGSANHTNFPVLINLSSDTSIRDNAQADGDDILFTSANGTTKLDHEIEKYTTATGALVAWVEVPSLDYNDDTVIYIYYGNSGASNQQSVTAAWPSAYKMVTHLKESGDGTSGEFADSTSNNNDGQGGAGSGSSTPIQTTSGKIGNAQNFDGTDDFISIGDPATLDFERSDSFTLSAWIKTADNTFNSIIGKLGASTAYPGYRLIKQDSGKIWLQLINSWGADNRLIIESTNTVDDDVWHYIVATYSGTSDPSGVSLYIDGQAESTSTIHNSLSASVLNDVNLEIGRSGSGAAYEPFDDLIDEVRISASVLDPDWIATEFNNQDSPATFYDLGAQEFGTRTYAQSAYRFFTANNGTNVGAALASQDSSVTFSSANTIFRLRLLLHVGAVNLTTSGQNFKLQYAQRSGTCDTSFTGETYADITSSSTIAYYDNTLVSDGVALTSNGSDPTHGGDTVVNQTYEESNNFTNSQGMIQAGQDGNWDFSLIDKGGYGNYGYCIRAVLADDTELDSYSVIPEIEFLPSLTFSIASVGANTVNNGITTSVASTATTLPFGNLSLNTPRFVAHALTVVANTGSGYTVTMRVNPIATIQGLYPTNVIDPFSAGSVSWSSPIGWTSPTGTTKNVNSGWIGANTTDTRVPGWDNAAQKFGPVSTNANPVMQSSTADTGTTAYVTYAIEINVLQPSDLYSGQIVYNVLPTY